MSEARNQHEVVVWFSQNYPEYYNHLWAINNDTHYTKSVGLLPGVADLNLLVPRKGILCGIEIKYYKSYFPIHHIENQLEWGLNLITNGGLYLMSSDVKQIKEYITKIIEGDKSYELIQQRQFHVINNDIKEAKSKNQKTVRVRL